ncbi:potassium channel family protein [Thioclava pacifica]|uniref:Potassium channel domain-containing protein n=1 Tax=Thioclava pacifica DSM 10166 TaxID=1353537 RepID=A0A074JVJ3_9RHOB|nr:potassium channel family protein [Thioclava pacifica]KEO53367.1 hypothetical protein TP2_17970 [Thioclava pacifica DSM 10166]
MLHQIAIGSLMMLITVSFAATTAWAMEAMFVRASRWLMREPHGPKMLLIVIGAALWALAMVTASVWSWAICFRLLDVFHTMEEAVYFALVVYTTLGYGDIILDHNWRILGGMAAANGLLNIGFLTAMMVEALRQTRKSQLEARRIKAHSNIHL